MFFEGQRSFKKALHQLPKLERVSYDGKLLPRIQGFSTFFPSQDRRSLWERQRFVYSENLFHQVLPPGIVTEPQLCTQAFYRSCLAASFIGVFEAITNHRLDQTKLMENVRRTNFTYEDSLTSFVKTDLFAIFNTPTFQSRYGETHAYKTNGFDFYSLRVAAQKAKAYDSRCQVYFLPGLTSEVSTNGNHLNTLLYADRDFVYTLDPASIEGLGGKRKIPKREYLQRWTDASQDGMLVIHFPNTSYDPKHAFTLQMWN